MPNPSLLAAVEEQLVPEAPTTMEFLKSLVDIVTKPGSDPNKDFFYLGGPMSGIAKFNFPRFHEAAAKLRDQGYNIVSPAELDDPLAAASIVKSHDGLDPEFHTDGKLGLNLVSRDLIVVSLPTCVGGIFLEGWHKSTGANIESYVIDRLAKQVLEYDDSSGHIVLTAIDRDTRLAELDDIDNAVDRKIAERESFWQIFTKVVKSEAR